MNEVLSRSTSARRKSTYISACVQGEYASWAQFTSGPAAQQVALQANSGLRAEES